MHAVTEPFAMLLLFLAFELTRPLVSPRFPGQLSTPAQGRKNSQVCGMTQFLLGANT